MATGRQIPSQVQFSKWPQLQNTVTRITGVSPPSSPHPCFAFIKIHFSLSHVSDVSGPDTNSLRLRGGGSFILVSGTRIKMLEKGGDLKRWQRVFIPPAISLSAEIHLEHLCTAAGYRNFAWKYYRCSPNPRRLKW